MNTIFIIYTFVTLVCFFQIIILTCEATRQKRQIEELIRDIQLLEGTQERFSEQLMKMNELNQRLNNLEWHVTNLNALHKVEVYPTSTDKYNPLNPSKVFYDTNTHVECDSKPETINFTDE